MFLVYKSLVKSRNNVVFQCDDIRKKRIAHSSCAEVKSAAAPLMLYRTCVSCELIN